MGMNETPSGERVHIAFFGRRNAGKSSLVNAVTGQELAIVSDIRGTTTDPVYKSMELLPSYFILKNTMYQSTRIVIISSSPISPISHSSFPRRYVCIW